MPVCTSSTRSLWGHKATYRDRSHMSPSPTTADSRRLMRTCLSFPAAPPPEQGVGSRMARGRLREGQQPTRIAHEDGVDLALAVAALLHHRHDVAEDVAVAMAAEAREPRAVADVVADHDAVEMALVDQGADQAEPRRVVRHVDIGEPVVARFLAEQVELDGHAGVRQLQQARLIEHGTVDVADHDPLGRMAGRLDEVGDLLRLIWIAAGMDVDRR